MTVTTYFIACLLAVADVIAMIVTVLAFIGTFGTWYCDCEDADRKGSKEPDFPAWFLLLALVAFTVFAAVGLTLYEFWKTW